MWSVLGGMYWGKQDTGTLMLVEVSVSWKALWEVCELGLLNGHYLPWVLER